MSSIFETYHIPRYVPIPDPAKMIEIGGIDPGIQKLLKDIEESAKQALEQTAEKSSPALALTPLPKVNPVSKIAGQTKSTITSIPSLFATISSRSFFPFLPFVPFIIYFFNYEKKVTNFNITIYATPLPNLTSLEFGDKEETHRVYLKIKAGEKLQFPSEAPYNCVKKTHSKFSMLADAFNIYNHASKLLFELGRLLFLYPSVEHNTIYNVTILDNSSNPYLKNGAVSWLVPLSEDKTLRIVHTSQKNNLSNYSSGQLEPSSNWNNIRVVNIEAGAPLSVLKPKQTFKLPNSPEFITITQKPKL